MAGMFSSPDLPSPPPPTAPPEAEDPEVRAAARRQRVAAAQMRGRASTILTGEQGDPDLGLVRRSGLKRVLGE